MTLGAQKLLAWRIAAGISQKVAGARVGVCQPTWRDWETGTKTPRLEHAFDIKKLTKRQVLPEHFIMPGVPAAPVASAEAETVDA
jgi:DNA-binding XRE family transcriptional regulator